MRLMMNHELTIDGQLLENFYRASQIKDNLTDAFSLTKIRLEDLEQELRI